MAKHGNPFGDPAGFVASAPVFDRPLRGGTAGILSPGMLAREELGDVHWGTLHAYMHRRFGPANMPSDPDALVAQWRIATPMEGLFLSVLVRPGDVETLFGFLADDETYGEIASAHGVRSRAARKRYEAWCIATHGRLPGYWTIHEAATPPSPEEQERLKQEATEWFDAFRRQEISQDVLKDPFSRAEQALRRTLRDLKRTVQIRDLDFSVLGEGRSCEDVGIDERSGRVAPPYAYGEDAWKINGAIIRMGGGATGMATALQALGVEAD